MELTLGFSSCPNDTFIFDALVHGKIDTEGLKFKVIIADVERLNELAFEGKIDITKLSYHAFCFVASNYKLLTCGSALGRGNGPLLIAKNLKSYQEIISGKVAIPGKFTTANLLFNIFYPESVNKVELLFSEIEDAILNNRVDSGVIIHENRFTFTEKGLYKIVDLGEKWETETGLPIPLGGIAIHNRHSGDLHQKFNRILHRSILYAFQNPDSSTTFIKKHAQNMKDESIRKHIDLYVNSFSVDLGNEGKKAIFELYKTASKKGLIELNRSNIFVE